MKYLYSTCLLFILIFGAFLPAGYGQPDYTSFPQETLSYRIRKFGITAGRATLQYYGLVEHEGRSLLKIVFTADGFNFYDKETIYADPKTFLPIQVERDLNIFGKKEYIVERYDPARQRVEVSKYKGETVIDTIVFEKDAPIDNLYCFIYRYRMDGRFKINDRFTMHLPTKSVVFDIERETSLQILNRKERALLMRSDPREYTVWFGMDEHTIPLRIDGAVGLAQTAMILEKHESGKIQ